MVLMYCKKCGRIVQDIHKCDVCGSETYQVPDLYLNDCKLTVNMKKEQQFIDECIKSSPEFDQTLFDKRDKILAEHNVAYERIMQNVVKCTYCGSTNVKKLSVFSRITSTSLGWIDSGGIGKQFHCNHCGADF